MKSVLVVVGAALLVGTIGYVVTGAKSARAAGVQNDVSEPRLGGVRIRASRKILEKVRVSATRVGWTESRYDEQGRLVLTPPSNYQSEDFGRLLDGIDRYKDQIEGLQLLGPNGGPVDADGIEHVDKK